MKAKIASYLNGALLAAALSCSGAALAQNNPGGPDDKSGTATNIPGKTGTPGTFNAKTDTTSTSAAPGSAGGTSATGSDSVKPRDGAPTGKE